MFSCSGPRRRPWAGWTDCRERWQSGGHQLPSRPSCLLGSGILTPAAPAMAPMGPRVGKIHVLFMVHSHEILFPHPVLGVPPVAWWAAYRGIVHIDKKGNRGMGTLPVLTPEACCSSGTSLGRCFQESGQGGLGGDRAPSEPFLCGTWRASCWGRALSRGAGVGGGGSREPWGVWAVPAWWVRWPCVPSSCRQSL